MNYRTIVIMFLCVSGIKAANFNHLLTCNLKNMDIASICDVKREIALYEQSLVNESNYSGVPQLDGWIDEGFAYPVVHPLHKKILDITKDLAIDSICELGAGCGKISKYIYYQKPKIRMTCVEQDAKHLQQIQENFVTKTNIILPDIAVNAQVFKGSMHDLSFLPADNFDLVFTCTVMMHLPFIIAVKAAQEIVRVSKKYILHVENKNQGGDWYSMAIVKPDTMSPVNLVGIDYVKLYESLGVKTIIYTECPYWGTPATAVIYLGEKISE